MRRGLAVGLSVVVIVAAAASVSAASGTSSTIVAAWTELGPSKLQVARVVVSGGGCPKLSVRLLGGQRDVPMEVRARSDGKLFSDTVCEAAIPEGTTEASVPGHRLPLRSKKLRGIALVGDTGCATSGSKLQNCDDPKAWPFKTVAGSIAAEHPDLIIHLGDIFYRKTKGCKEGCSAGLNADFFDPAAPMLAAAPLVMVRGNHDADGADCVGWFRYFEPTMMSAVSSCTPAQRFTEPYKINLTADRELVVLDTSAAAENALEDIPEYRMELQQANALAEQPAWLISHVPLWDVARGGRRAAEKGPGILQQALKNLGKPLSPNFRMVISGHLHQFEWLSFLPLLGRARVPAQLILGDGGTMMSKAESGSFAGKVVDKFNHITASAGAAESTFGYGVIQLKIKPTSSADPKSVTIKKDNGTVLKECELHRYDLHCSSPQPGPTPSPGPGCQDAAGAYNQGFDSAFKSGFNSAFNSGFNSGYRAGFQSGFNDGFDVGFRHSVRTGGASSPLSARAQAIAAQATYPACNAQFNQGFNTGFNSGFQTGFNPRFNSGFNAGFRAGFNAGFNAGFRARHRRHRRHR
jgi:predicted phosphodiesterase